MKTMTLAGAVALVSLLSIVAGCNAPVGVTLGALVPKDGVQLCADVCTKMGTNLSSIVVMASNVGCVCEPKPAAPTGAAPATSQRHRGADAALGMVAILAAERERQQQDTRPYAAR
jgi:hypothetical protein